MSGQGGGQRGYDAVPFPLVESKLATPFARPGLVQRTEILDLLASETAASTVSVVAPAGYGKSTLLHQWTERDSRPSTWLTLDTDDNDPVVLLTYLAVALDRVIPVDSELVRLLAVEQPSITAITRALGSALAASPHSAALVLDDVYTLENPACHDILAMLIEHVPAESQIALASRSELPLPVSRLRAEGRIFEIGPYDLALDVAEATSLLENAGVELKDGEVHELVDVSEGWAAAIYLAGRSVKERGRGGTLDLAHVGQSRQIVAYAHGELLSALPSGTAQFLTRASVLDRMSGPMCDAVLRTYSSAERLESLVQSNLLVIPLDDHRGWYRFHHMFRDLLRAELELREPALVPELNRRAGLWCQANGLLDAAVDYAMAAGDTDRAALIVQQRGQMLYRAGRAVTLRRWFDWFDDGGHVHRYPGVAMVGAWVAALTGRAAAAERWTDAAEHAQLARTVFDGSASSLEGQLALLRAFQCRHGMDEALVDAHSAVRLIPVDSSWRATALAVLGLAYLFTGSREDADRILVEAVTVGREIDASPAVSVALAERALIALDRGELAEAHALADQACAVVDDGRLQDHVTNVFVFAVAARLAMRAGGTSQAERLVTRAQRLRPRLTYAMPQLAVQSRLELIRTMVSLADGPGARTVLREVDDILRVRPKLGVMTAQVKELRARIAGTPVGGVGASSLTAAELRLVPLLQTHLTFREIGGRLFVSPHTVKTQAISIYRKLGVSSRSDAMRVASEVGLLSD
jgi:LuxR family maltose regulon positive regulatory protein